MDRFVKGVKNDLKSSSGFNNSIKNKNKIQQKQKTKEELINEVVYSEVRNSSTSN